MNTRRLVVAVTALIGTLGVGLVACGGSSNPSTASSVPSSTPTTAEASPAGDIPDSQVFVAFTPQGAGYTLTVPEGWARTDLPTGATFTDKLNSIRVESAPAPVPPTAGSKGTTTTVHRTAGDALLVTYQQDSAPDPVTGKTVKQDLERYEFWKNGTQVTITLTSPQGADNVDPWKTVTDTFAW